MIESSLEKIVFKSRWLLAPLYIGLVGGLFFIFIKFTQEFIHILMNIAASPEREVILSVLALVDMTLVANLLIMVIFSGYENFVSKIDIASDSVDRPDWMGKVDYSGLKLKLIGSIVAISAIDLLKAFMHQSTPGVEQLSNTQLAWMVGIHMTFVVSGVMFALMDYLAEKAHKVGGGH